LKTMISNIWPFSVGRKSVFTDQPSERSNHVQTRSLIRKYAAALVVGLSGFVATVNLMPAQLWTAATQPAGSIFGPPSPLASSADGMRVIATSYVGPISVSTDAGVTWTSTSSPEFTWISFASSADGTKLAAAAGQDDHPYGSEQGDGSIYISIDSGATWSRTTALINRNWASIAISADGAKLVAAEKGESGVGGSIYTSTNLGASWVTTSAPTNGWGSIASSADGTRLAGVGLLPEDGIFTSAIYTSRDSGASWLRTSAPINNWTAIASSADGIRLVAVSGFYNTSVFSGDGLIYTSLDSGATWTAAGAPVSDWEGVASSADGTRLVAASGSGPIYFSNNSGASWEATAAPSFGAWASLASSADGYRIVVSGGLGLCTLPYLGPWRSANATAESWGALALGADGTKLLVTGFYNRGSSTIYTSSDSGVTGTQMNSRNHWTAVASSADGAKLVATATAPPAGNGFIYTSSDSGAHWVPTQAPTNAWVSVASSADGSKLVAVADYPTPYTLADVGDGLIYISSNWGSAWTATAAPRELWTSVASSADGVELAAVGTGTPIYLSTNSGLSWLQSTAPTENWTSVAASADGTKLVAAATGPISIPALGFQGTNYSGSQRIYLSKDSGASWAPCSAPNNSWACVSSSANGARLVAAATSMLYISDDAGTNWAPSDAPAQFWSAIRVSADASTVVAVGDGPICILRSPPPVPPLPPSPVLSIGMSSATPAVSWLVPSTSFVLQQCSDLGSPNWVDVATKPALNFANLHNEVKLPLRPTSTCFRLKQP
jgi:hypothetical protein